jgi:hypothetical protein
MVMVACLAAERAGIVRHLMTRHRAAAVVLLAGILACGCQKEKGSGAGGGGGGGSALDYPADTTAILGFVRTGTPPSADQIKGALNAALGEEADREMLELVDVCIAPVVPHLERTTVVVRGDPREERAIVFASGPGLRPAIEGCLEKSVEKDGKSFAPGEENGFTSYKLGGGDPLTARWTGTDQVVLGGSKEEITSATSAAGGLKGTPLEKVVGAVDRSASIWFAAAGPNLPQQAEIESVSGTVKDLRGTARAVFKSPEAAQRAGAMAQMVIPKGIKFDGSALDVGVSVVDLPTLIPGKKGMPMSKEHAQALVDAGPLMVAFFLLAGDSQEVEAAPPVPAEAAPAPEGVPPVPPAEPAQPAPPAEPTPP